jgi:hypothetical protein
MSAKNRGEPADPMDYGCTPGWTTRAILPQLGAPPLVMDLGCGNGEIGAVLRRGLPCAARIEIPGGSTPVYDAVAQVDVCSEEMSRRFAAGTYDLVIGNPPFNQALAFLIAAQRIVRPGGLIALLLRDSWQVPTPRRGLDKAYKVSLRRRPSFKTSAKGNKSDSTEYAWHLWSPGMPWFAHGHWDVIECEPPERKRRLALPGAPASPQLAEENDTTEGSD